MSKLIVFEGINRSGKTTQINRLYDHLKKTTSLKIFKTRQPWNEDVRNKLKTVPMTASEQFDLIIKDRADHCEFIKEKLDTHDLVLCDRFTQSSIAYQGYGGGMDNYYIRKANEIATRGLIPHLVLIFDCPVHVALRRGFDTPLTVMETNLYFMGSVKRGYLNLANDNSYPVIDASRSEDLIFFDVLKEISSVIPNIYSVIQ